MKKAKKFFLLNERRETWRIRFEAPRIAFCATCGTDVEWLTTHDSMRVLGINEIAVLKLTDAADVHSHEDDRGFLFFCRTSLERFGAKELDHENG